MITGKKLPKQLSGIQKSEFKSSGIDISVKHGCGSSAGVLCRLAERNDTVEGIFECLDEVIVSPCAKSQGDIIGRDEDFSFRAKEAFQISRYVLRLFLISLYMFTQEKKTDMLSVFC